jgi:hypothetical protein
MPCLDAGCLLPCENRRFKTRICDPIGSQAAQSYPVLLIYYVISLYNSILKIIRKSCVINLLRYIFI